MNLTYVVSAYPAGRLSDRIGRVGLLMIGLVILIVADSCSGGDKSQRCPARRCTVGPAPRTDAGPVVACVADTAPADLRGSAFGVFNFVSGMSRWWPVVLAGGLWNGVVRSITFGAGAVLRDFALAACWWRRFRHGKDSRTQRQSVDRAFVRG